MPASNSEDNRDPDQDTDDPLPNREDVNAALPGYTAEHYVPWFGDSPEHVGLMPAFLLWFSGLSIPLMGLIVVLSIIPPVAQFSAWILHLEDPLFGASFPLDYMRIALPALINWSPLLGVYWFLLCYPQSSKLTFGTVLVICACLFGLLSWAYCALVSPEKDGKPFLHAWSTGTVPQSFRGCDARVEPSQVSLFETDIYYTQFARATYIIYSNSTRRYKLYDSPFDMERFRSIQMDQNLCNHGFEGNNGLYGLGIRTSLYLQWISSFLANNLLPGTRQELQKAYLIFSLAICLATIIASFAEACVFSIEIEIIYWMYWGGYMCVFASAPCPVRLGSEMKWIKIDWTTVILFTTHALMIYHGIWFSWYAYDRAFSRMPCGTYHFFFFPFLDPSEGFWTLRDYLTHLVVPFFPALLATFPFVSLLLASEVKYTIQHSAIYQTLFPRPTAADRDQPQATEHNASVKASLGLQVYLFIARPYKIFREKLNLPSHSRGGIRLVTPIGIRDRRCVAFMILTSLRSANCC